MSTTLKIDNINQLLEENRAMVGVASSPTCLYILHLIRSRPEITLDQINTEFTFRSGTAEDWLKHILEVGLVELKDSKYCLTPLGERKLALTDVSLEELGGTEIPGTEDVPNKLPDSYRLDPIPLGKGATSVTFRAIHPFNIINKRQIARNVTSPVIKAQVVVVSIRCSDAVGALSPHTVSD